MTLPIVSSSTTGAGSGVTSSRRVSPSSLKKPIFRFRFHFPFNLPDLRNGGDIVGESGGKTVGKSGGDIVGCSGGVIVGRIGIIIVLHNEHRLSELVEFGSWP